MSEKRLRISIIGLLAVLAIASVGCGGGGSRANPAGGGDFISAVMPDVGSAPTDAASTPTIESGSAVLGEQSSDGGGENGPGNPAQNPQTSQQVVGNSNLNEGGGNEPGGPTENTQIEDVERPEIQGYEYVDFQEEGYPLPWEHGLPVGRIMMFPGEKEKHGNLVFTCPASASATCTILVMPDSSVLSGGSVLPDGSVIYDLATPPPIVTLIPPGGFPDNPLPLATEAAQAPVVELDFGTTLHVGAGVTPRAGELTAGDARSGVSVSYGHVRDGIAAEEILEFMNQHVSLENKLAHAGPGFAPGLLTYHDPPTVRLAEGTSDLYARFAAHAVQLINRALPYEKRITLSAEPLPADTRLGDVPFGEIFLKFGSLTPSGKLSAVRGSNRYLIDSETNELQKALNALRAHVTINEQLMREAIVYDPPPDPVENTDENWKIILQEYWKSKILDSRVENSDTIIKWHNDRILLSLVVRELLLPLGLFTIDETRFPESIMHPYINKGQVNVYSPHLPIGSGVIFILFREEDVIRQSETIDMTSGAAATIGEATNQDEDEETIIEEPDSELRQGYLMTPDSRAVVGHILFPLDRAALLAAYGRFAPGAQPEDLTAENLGPWTDTSFHLRGDMELPKGQASFGVASANGLAQPWAEGPTPWTNLADNNRLSGSATWSGALLGMTSTLETVAGDSSLSVNLASLNGQLDFTGLETWGAEEAPGTPGSGETWGDGDLGYTVQVRGNTFIQTGGDDGHVTGAFFGVNHEAMGGVLERADLTAAFGGKR